VPDDIIARMKSVTLEEAWAVLRGDRFNYQFEGGWQVLDPEDVLVGRAVTATFMPGRPDIHAQYDQRGRQSGRSGSQNSWPIDMLEPGDVYVADQFGAYEDGPTVGDNLANAILGNSGNGREECAKKRAVRCQRFDDRCHQRHVQPGKGDYVHIEM
jgi:regulator of RNase E activity RraA